MREALGRFGLSGTVVLEGKTLELRGHGPPIAIDTGPVAEQWALLPEELRKKRGADLASRLAEAHRLAGGEADDERPIGERLRETVPSNVAKIAGGVLALLGLIFVVRLIINRVGGQDAVVDAGAPGERAEARAKRLAASCHAMRGNIRNGRDFGAFSAEGWVVELWLARRSGGQLMSDPSILRVLSGGRLTNDAHPELASVRDGAAEIAEGFNEQEARRSPHWRAVTIVMREGYARAYLDTGSREHFIDFAKSVSTAASADLAALYARCLDEPSHDAGAWFWGRQGGAPALLYAMGFFYDTPIVDLAALTAAGGPDDLDALIKLTGDLKQGAAQQAVRENNGWITQAGAAQFPLNAPNKATAASRAIAALVGVGKGASP